MKHFNENVVSGGRVLLRALDQIFDHRIGANYSIKSEITVFRGVDLGKKTATRRRRVVRSRLVPGSTLMITNEVVSCCRITGESDNWFAQIAVLDASIRDADYTSK